MAEVGEGPIERGHGGESAGGQGMNGRELGQKTFGEKVGESTGCVRSKGRRKFHRNLENPEYKNTKIL